MKKIIWRYVIDEKYGGYAIQRLRKFLWWSWWSDEFLCYNEENAILITNYKQNQCSLTTKK